MSTQTRYRLVVGKPSTVAEDVTRLLQEGWVLLGAPSAAYNGYTVSIAQALTIVDEVK